MARVLLGVTGGIAAYKALELTRLATKAGHGVRVVMTEAATRFVGPQSFASITGAPVLRTEWEPDPLRGSWPGEPLPDQAPLSHLALVERADVYVIAPASANTLAKLAHGFADSLVTTAALARSPSRPTVVAPAMNHEMYGHPATQANLALLAARGVTVLTPGTGALGSPGEWGIGRLPEPAELLEAIEAALHPAHPQWVGKHVLVSAGGTREPLDAVRFLGNRSSGKMGWALAEEAAARGARVTLLAANVALADPAGVDVVRVETTAQLQEAALAAWGDVDVLLMAAAVADYTPAEVFAGKRKKDPATQDGLTLELVRTPDVLASLSERRRPGQVLVGFAAEHGPEGAEHARSKRTRKGLDAVVLNDVATPGIAFDSAENEVTLVTAAGDERLARAPKREVAAAILDRVVPGAADDRVPS